MKKTLKALLVTALLITMLMAVVSAETTDSTVLSSSLVGVHHQEHAIETFTDAPAKDSWKYQGLNCAVNNGVMNGHEGKLRPDDSLTRAEMVAMIVRVLDAYDIKADISAYIDVSSDSWYYDYVSSGVAAKFINGSGNKMMPNDPITREQTFAVLARTFLFTPKTEDASSAFSDEAKLSGWAEYATNALIDAKVVLGDSTNTLRPLENVTRAEMAALLDRIVCYFLKADVNYNGLTIDGSVILSDASVNLDGITINGDLYIVDGLGKENIDLSGVTVTGRVVIRGGDVKVPAGSNLNIVRPEDYNEDPEGDDDDDVVNKEEGSLPSGGGGGGQEDERTHITYSINGGATKKIYATYSENDSVITFDFTTISASDLTKVILKDLYIKGEFGVICTADGFNSDTVNVTTNTPTSLREILSDMIDDTTGQIAGLLGISDDIEEDMSLAELGDTVAVARELYAGSFQHIFDGRYITCPSSTRAEFACNVGTDDVTIVMITQ